MVFGYLKHFNKFDTFRLKADKMDRAEKKALMYKMRAYRENMSKDDKEFIKAKDRARKARETAEMTEEERAERRERDRQRKALKRAEQRNMSAEVQDMEKELDRKRKSIERAQERHRKGVKKNAHLTGYQLNEREQNRQYKMKKRNSRGEEEVRYDNLKLLLRMRDLRKSRTKEQQIQDKAKAQEGMRKIRYSGFAKDFYKRSKTKFKDVDRLWRDFWDSSIEAKKLMKEKEPEIAKRLEEEDEIEPDTAIRLAQEDQAKEAELKKANAERIKAWRKKKRLELQKALDEPIIMPELEKSEYERIRDENVRQLEEALKEF